MSIICVMSNSSNQSTPPIAPARSTTPDPTASAGRLPKARRPKLVVRPDLPRGVYMWGGVGRGKSFLMDSFYAVVPVRSSIRAVLSRTPSSRARNRSTWRR